MLKKSSRVLLKIRISRFFRSTYRKVKNKIQGIDDTTYFPGTEEVKITKEIDAHRVNKIKSTIVVGIASIAIGVAQMSSAAAKSNKTLTPKSALTFGLVTGAISSYVWYNYMNAAAEGVTEDDIMMMFEMAHSTGYGRLDETDEGLKSFDIIHSIITGTELEYTFGQEKEEEEDDDKAKDPDEEDFEPDGSTFAILTEEDFEEDFYDDDDEDDDEEEDDRPTGFGNARIGKPSGSGFSKLKSDKPSGFSKIGPKRKSLIPDIDQDEDEEEFIRAKRADTYDSWLDI